jgi:ribosomal protein S1
MAYLHPCRTCGQSVSNEAVVCPMCGQPEPVLEPSFLAEIGKVYVGRVTSTTTFGAFVEIAPGVEGLLHISELAQKPVARTEDVVRKGDVIQVRLLEVDEKGRVKLSLKSL